MSACSSCGAAILWSITPNGKRMPLDEEPVPHGNVIVHTERGQLRAETLKKDDERRESGEPLYLSHHATCPHGKSWRRK